MTDMERAQRKPSVHHVRSSNPEIFGNFNHDPHLDAAMTEAFSGAFSAVELRSLLQFAVRHFGIKNAIYYALSVGGENAGQEFGAMTYPENWHRRYEEAGYRRIDPTVRAMMHSFAPCDWREMDWSAPAARRLLTEAAEYAVGNQGYSIPLHGPMGQFAMFNISFEGDNDAWSAKLTQIRQPIFVFAHDLHQRVMARLAHDIAPPEKMLSPRERDVLTLVATGKRRGQIAEMLQISENTIRVYLDSARHKLGAINSFQAVAIAVKNGEIRV